MALEVILLEDVNSLGTIGDTVRVADGFARNYLLPRHLAAEVTPENMRRLESKKRAMQKEYEQRVSIAQSLADRISQESVTIPVEATEDDKLYGSITQHQIADVLKEQGIEIQREAILMDEPIRELGVYNLEVHLHQQVETTLKVWIVRK